ncbi:transposon Ty3-I Gag-Pol polyprotein [Trichonephila inaurata madagascariensis]|uniref:RNA-directed DNA polymerase n=1 Tax=Trichonephila inaurata madagascariensis TaxID=2747483 RepID=A0A8X6WMA9_9ARAC|nr:transposon Ty3-I Gag-Pol polyprotein [Trichonephila inaurata madagascariensis]
MFGCSEVPFVGYLVDKDGILPLPEKVELIAIYKQPTTVRDLRKFLGILNFYRKFLPKAAHIQAPLHEFLKNSKRNDKREVEWNAEAINAFNQCKNQLANVTLLAHPSQDADLALMTDASDFGLGASLNEITSHDYEEFAQMQRGDDELKALLSATNQTLQLKQLRMPETTTEIYCDISTSTLRPYVPHTLPRNVFLAVHNLSHPGIRATAKLISKRELCACLGISKIRTTPYHPASNGLVQRTHRSLKTALMAHATPRWTQVLPFVLLGLRSVINATAAEMVYGTTIRLPSDFFQKKGTNNVSETFSMYSRIFTRHDAIRKPLQPPYDGPFIVVKHSEKLITLQRQGKEICVSIDRVKPAFISPDTIESNQPSVIPKTQEVPATQTTRSGRRVHFPQRYVST